MPTTLKKAALLVDFYSVGVDKKLTKGVAPGGYGFEGISTKPVISRYYGNCKVWAEEDRILSFHNPLTCSYGPYQ